MSSITKVILFDVTGLPSYELEKFRERVDRYTFLSDVKVDKRTFKISHIRAFFECNVNIPKLLSDFSGVTYTDITGTDLMHMF